MDDLCNSQLWHRHYRMPPVEKGHLSSVVFILSTAGAFDGLATELWMCKLARHGGYIINLATFNFDFDRLQFESKEIRENCSHYWRTICAWNGMVSIMVWSKGMAPVYISEHWTPHWWRQYCPFLCCLWAVSDLSGPDTALCLELYLGLTILSLMLYERTERIRKRSNTAILLRPRYAKVSY
jgi:hypothetical protein